MAAEHFFDVVSKIDTQELSNALDQVRKELVVRYDFRGISTEIKHEGDKLVILTADEYKLKAVRDILESKLMRRGLDLKILGEPKNEPASGGQIRSTVPLVSGISSDKTKLVNKLIREQFPKAKTVVQGDEMRVQSKSIDELQAIMQLLKNSPQIDIPLQFTNYR